jgi:hypothetical protein
MTVKHASMTERNEAVSTITSLQWEHAILSACHTEASEPIEMKHYTINLIGEIAINPKASVHWTTASYTDEKHAGNSSGNNFS